MKALKPMTTGVEKAMAPGGVTCRAKVGMGHLLNRTEIAEQFALSRQWAKSADCILEGAQYGAVQDRLSAT